MAQKFIINKNNLVLGDVRYHKELSDDHSTTKGGGGWYIIPHTNILLLYGLSADFGKAKLSDVEHAISGYATPFYSWGGLDIKLEKNYQLAFSEELFLQRAQGNYTIIKTKKDGIRV